MSTAKRPPTKGQLEHAQQMKHRDGHGKFKGHPLTGDGTDNNNDPTPAGNSAGTGIDSGLSQPIAQDGDYSDC
jgi:hypothetical protein